MWHQVPDHAPRLWLVLLPVDGLCRRDGNVLLVGLGDFHRREAYLPWFAERADGHVANVHEA